MEVVHAHKDGSAIVLREGSAGHFRMEAKDILRWWSISAPLGELPPPWYIRGKPFYGRIWTENRAVLWTVKRGGVSYMETCKAFADVFRILTLEDFDKHWIAAKGPSVWDRVGADWEPS